MTSHPGPQTDQLTKSAPCKEPERTCVGCGKRDRARFMVRLVRDAQGQIVVDLDGKARGRGAHVHPVGRCLRSATKQGLSRGFRTNVRCALEPLCAQLVQAANQKLTQLLEKAIRAGEVLCDERGVQAGLQQEELQLVVVACDAEGMSLSRTVSQAVVQGRAVAWGSQKELGKLLGQENVALLGIRSRLVGRAIAEVCRVADGARLGAEVR